MDICVGKSDIKHEAVSKRFPDSPGETDQRRPRPLDIYGCKSPFVARHEGIGPGDIEVVCHTSFVQAASPQIRLKEILTSSKAIGTGSGLKRTRSHHMVSSLVCRLEFGHPCLWLYAAVKGA